MSALAGSRKLTSAVKQASLDKLIDGYLEVYHQVKHLENETDTPQ